MARSANLVAAEKLKAKVKAPEYSKPSRAEQRATHKWQKALEKEFARAKEASGRHSSGHRRDLLPVAEELSGQLSSAGLRPEPPPVALPLQPFQPDGRGACFPGGAACLWAFGGSRGRYAAGFFGFSL